MHNVKFDSAILDILLAHPQGISEYELIRLLQQPPYQLIKADALADNHVMFQTHFILFNSLYRLRHRLLTEQRGNLLISASNIKRLPFSPGEDALQQSDKLQAYYLDWRNLHDTSEDDVDAMLERFWLRMAGISEALDPDTVQQAFTTLELHPNATLLEAKQQYRRLLHQAHPDKGGDSERTVALKQAFDIASAHLKHQ